MQQVCNPTPLQPACPSCGRMLCLTRTIPRTNALELRTYGCQERGVRATEAADDWNCSACFEQLVTLESGPQVEVHVCR